MTYESIKEKADAHWNDRAHGNTPLIRVGSAMCGHAAGAFRVKKTILETLNNLNVDANVDEVGCIGLCYAEPIIDIKKKGHPRLFFKNVTPARAGTHFCKTISSNIHQNFVFSPQNGLDKTIFCHLICSVRSFGPSDRHFLTPCPLQNVASRCNRVHVSPPEARQRK